ncbi:methyltransferase [Escherichia coli]|uniref:methyltransferase n=1 Tax=Escherichia coli TaxID=562 RepID=UPI00050668E0|nr:methyltransferase [Escherichia coli]EHY2151943.1 methyltransferase domain-containing protein [Escherichia coli O157]EEQ2695609.1 methyltransferase domain-containing protein [Escherichia coli]EEQ3101350.1 methyltransferase domain-containing protein [Escherichia coli]EES2499296.1 methyltransferase domain-containing protein [Escherichia coli]EEW0866910.1 methyltransferase domain-containing protein [Escherichia coli]
MYEQDTLSTLDAITEAQRIAFAPMLFQAALCLRNAGILDYLDQQGKQGAPLNAITEQTVLNEYAVSVLLDMGLSGRIITCKEGNYYLAKIGHYLLHDTMTRVNMDFTQDVCYQGLFFLADSLNEGKPSGLKVFGDWPTIYPALSQLPDAARASWFAFDHYYSDGAFNAALPYVFANNPTTLYDVGGNTGKWALRCCKYNENIAVTLLDLPQQIVLAKENIANAGFSDRIDFQAVDMLSDAPLPGEADIWWMSQFLDCFSPEQIISILSKIASVMKPAAKVCIMELFWDAQRFEAASFSLNASSLYFTCMANGNSRFYSAEKFYDYLNKAGFQVAERHDNLGVGHTLLICQKK